MRSLLIASALVLSSGLSISAEEHLTLKKTTTFGTNRFRTTEPTWETLCLAFASNSTSLISGGPKGLSFYEVPSGQPKRLTLKSSRGDSGRVGCAAFSHDNTLAFALIYFYEMAVGIKQKDNNSVLIIPMPSPVSAICWSPNAEVLFVSDNEGCLTIFDAKNGFQKTDRIQGHQDSPRSLCFFNENVVSADRHSVVLWEINPKKKKGSHQLYRDNSEDILCISSLNGQGLLILTTNSLLLVDQSGSVLWKKPVPDDIFRGIIAENGQFALYYNKNNSCFFKWWFLESKKETIPTDGILNNITMSSDGKYVACLSGESIELFQTDGWIRTHFPESHLNTITFLSFIDNDQQLVSTSEDRTIRLWEMKSEKLIKTLTAYQDYLDYSNVIACDVAARKLAWGNVISGSIQSWDLDKGQLLNTIRAHQSFVNALTFVPNYDAFASVGDYPHGEVLLTKDAQKPETLFKFNRGYAGTAICASKTGNFLAASFVDKTIRVWDISKKRLVLKAASSGDYKPMWLRFSPNEEEVIAAYPDGKIEILNVLKKQITRVVQVGALTHGDLYRYLPWIEIDPNWKYMVVVDPTGTGFLKEMGSFETIATFDPGQVSCLAFSSDGKKLAVGNTNTIIQIWEIESNKGLLKKTD